MIIFEILQSGGEYVSNCQKTSSAAGWGALLIGWCRWGLASGVEGAGGCLLIGVEACSGDFDGAEAAVGGGECHVGVVYEGEDGVLRAVYVYAPGAVVGVEVEAHDAAVVLGFDGVAFAVAVHEIAAVGAFDHACAACHGVVAAPEFNAVEHEHVGECAHFVDGEYPECEEYEFVEELVADLSVPGEELVGEAEGADA